MATLGIMWDRMNKGVFKWQAKAIRAAGFDKLLLFKPDRVDRRYRTISGWVYENNQWRYEPKSPYPSIIYDRGIYSGRMLKEARQVKETIGIPFAGDWLGNDKWTIHKHLSVNTKLRPYLIPTLLLSHDQAVHTMLHKYKKAIIKPLGTHKGTGILKLSYLNGKYVIEENRRKSIHLSKEGLHGKLAQLRRKRNYLVQRWVDITDAANRVYDIRVLIQKNVLGQWHLTGMGVRLGKAGNITSNLATEGSAKEIISFLSKQFGHTRALRLEQKLRELAFEIAAQLERSFQKRLVELGLDFGIDRQFHIWIIEANAIPGKEVFKRAASPKVFNQSLQLPIYYAGFLHRRLSGGKTRRKQ
ncbi:YheC/D-like protein [Paenibacillus sp. BK033]|uniref:YheC/YheD family endospore coat-associated protein n=1 Tax=Paenibacillus sp. BK033 TaxID=2512133 RepID=UPI00104AD277|nr:YheC/YheD family protein [Paenibacillus sp. BK033]TCM92698.1 YheC/D-like protein [Paenibacillus sp. BK033]